MNILVTGATGFIGRNLVEELAKQKDNSIYCLVRPTSNISPLKFYKVKFIYADITSKQSLDKIKQKFDIVFHCAALVDDKSRSLQVPRLFQDHLANLGVPGDQYTGFW